MVRHFSASATASAVASAARGSSAPNLGPAPSSSATAVGREGTTTVEVRSQGECRSVMEGVRDDVFARYGSGLVMDDEGSDRLTAAVAEMEEVCGEQLASQFRAQELTPWLNHQVTSP